MSSEELSFNNKPILLEIYTKLLDSIEKNIDRRYIVNRFNLSILGALSAAFGFISNIAAEGNSSPLGLTENIFLAMVSLVSIVWLFQILRFREVSRIKHEVAMRIEQDLQAFGVTLEHQIETKSRTVVPYTTLELMFPASVLVGCSVMFFWN